MAVHSRNLLSGPLHVIGVLGRESRYTLAASPLLLAPKRLSAMVRVRNEEDFLYPSIRSIADQVDEIVIVDNLSTDGTPDIIRQLESEYRRKVVSFTYSFEVSRVGEENEKLASSDPESPHLLANYYNWCLKHCSLPFVLKWDGDMIATPPLLRNLTIWKRSFWPLFLAFRGANVHPNGTHLLGPKVIADPATLHNPYELDWLTDMAYTSRHWALFPKRGASFDTGIRHCERLVHPLLSQRGRLSRLIRLRMDEPAFLHLKYLKKDPHANHSPEFRRVIEQNVGVGPHLSDEDQALLSRWIPGR